MTSTFDTLDFVASAHQTHREAQNTQQVLRGSRAQRGQRGRIAGLWDFLREQQASHTGSSPRQAHLLKSIDNNL